MIHFAISESSLEVGIGSYLANRGRALQGKLQAHSYESLFPETSVPAGSWVFAGICTLTPAGRAVASQLRERLLSAGCRVLNDPERSLRRFDLLSAMYDAGVNRFRAVRAADYRGGLRFPLFIRNDRQHNGNISPLLHSESDLRRELFSTLLRGHPFEDLLIVEFRDLSVHGIFQKFSAFRVGDRILCRHAQSSTAWMIKSETGERTLETAQAEIDFIETNAHEDLLAPLFDIAKIEYGRMDYGYRDGRIEVWEINTAPTLGRNPHAKPDLPDRDSYRSMQEPSLLAFHDRLCKAFEAIDACSPQGVIPSPPETDAFLVWVRECAKRQRRERVLNRLRSVSQVPGIRGAWRTTESVIRGVLGGLSER